MVTKLVGRVKMRKCILAIYEHMHSRILCLEDKINIQVRFHVHKGRHWISGKFRVTHLYYWKSHAEPSI